MDGPFASVRAPDGPGAGSAISGYSGTSGTGTYTINLTGTNFVDGAAPVPEPATLLLLGSGLVGVAARIRKRQKAR